MQRKNHAAALRSLSRLLATEFSLFISSSIRCEWARIFSPTFLIFSRMISSSSISRTGKTNATTIAEIPKNPTMKEYLHIFPRTIDEMMALKIEPPPIERGVVNAKELQINIVIVQASPVDILQVKLEGKVA